jgi:DNA-directed RNA polymerase subunit RPC12/RpoP
VHLVVAIASKTQMTLWLQLEGMIGCDGGQWWGGINDYYLDLWGASSPLVCTAEINIKSKEPSQCHACSYRIMYKKQRRGAPCSISILSTRLMSFFVRLSP